MDKFYLYKSDKPAKRYVMVMPKYNHKHYFSSSQYDNYTIHKDEARAKLYRARHKNDPIDDVHSPGALAWYITWSKPTLAGGIREYEKRFGVEVVDRSKQVYSKGTLLRNKK